MIHIQEISYIYKKTKNPQPEIQPPFPLNEDLHTTGGQEKKKKS